MLYRQTQKIVSIITISIFFISNAIYAVPNPRSLFKNKKVDYKKLSTESEQDLEKKRTVLREDNKQQSQSYKEEARRILSSHLKDLSQIHIPSELGNVIEVYEAPETTGDRRLVVHIQDLHTNPEGQYNSAAILELLIKDYNLGLVCSEGAEGEVDTSSVSSFPDAEVREKTARLFVDSGELTGEEYLSITKYPDLPIWGIENKETYFKNIIQFNKIMKFSPNSQAFISQAKRALDQLKTKIYSKELELVDQKEADYENKKMETIEYMEYIASYIQRFNIPTDGYKNIPIMVQTIEQERAIDELKIKEEAQDLLLNLQSALSVTSRKDMDSLMVKARLFRDQKISPFSFYSYLKDLAIKHIPDKDSDYKNLNNFIDYLVKVNSLDAVKLFSEMKDLSYKIKQNLAQTQEQKNLITALRNIKFLEDFFNLKISSEELNYYLDNKESHKVAFFENFMRPVIEKYDIPYFIDFNPDLIDFHFEELEDFYETVKKRDDAMFKNSVAEIEKRNSKVTALISGGFHTEGIMRLLREKGYSYIVVSPHSSTEIDEENYRYLLSGKRKPISELLTSPEDKLRATLGFMNKDGFDAYNKIVAPELAELNGEERKDYEIGPLQRKAMVALILASYEQKPDITFLADWPLFSLIGVERNQVLEIRFNITKGINQGLMFKTTENGGVNFVLIDKNGDERVIDDYIFDETGLVIAKVDQGDYKSMTSTIKTKPTGTEEVLFEADSINNLIGQLQKDKKIDRANQVQILKDIRRIAFRDYSELALILRGKLNIKIVRNHIYNVAEYIPHTNTLMIDEILLNNFELLRQELLSEECRHMLYRLLLMQVRGRAPTLKEELIEEFATDMQKFKDILRIVKAEGRANLLEPLIHSTDKYNFYKILIRAIPKGQERDAVLNILFEKQLITESDKKILSELASFERDENMQVLALNDHYRQNPVLRRELQELVNRKPVTLKEIYAYNVDFASLREDYRKISKVPYIHLADISINLGPLLKNLIDNEKITFSEDKQEVTLVNKTNNKELTIKRVQDDSNGDIYLKIGQRTYKIDSSKRINLSSLFLLGQHINWVGNYSLVNFSGLSIKDILEDSDKAKNIPASGLKIHLVDQLKDPISRTAEPRLIADSPSINAISRARSILKSKKYYDKNDEASLYYRLNEIVILAQSNAYIEGITYEQAIEDRVIATDALEELILTTKTKAVEKLARELLYSIALLAIRDVPEKEYKSDIVLREKEMANINEKKPFIITSPEVSESEFQRLNDIFAHIVKEGNVKPYFIINIQNFTPNTFLAYSKFLKNISRRYNGNITFLLSIQPSSVLISGEEKLYKPFNHDMPGTYTSRRRVIDAFGKDFYLSEYIANISDGGEKTRAANAGVRYESWSKVLTNDGVSFLESNILTAGTMWLLLPDLGKDKRLWLASDGKIQFGRINIAGKPLSELPSDFQIAASGPIALIMTKEQREKLGDLFKRYGRWTAELDQSAEFLRLWPQIRANIKKRALELRGIFITNNKGEMLDFMEKGKKNPEDEEPPNEIKFRNITEFVFANTSTGDSGEVTENIFFLIENADISYNLVTELNRFPTNDKDRFLARKPVSVFTTIFQGFLSRGDTPVTRILKKYIQKIYGISYGEGCVVGDIADLEQHFLMWGSYLRRHKGPKEENVTLSKNITIRYSGNKDKLNYLLRDVTLTGKGTLEIGEGVLIQSSSIELEGDFSIPDRTKIIDSSLKAKYTQFHGQGGVVMGIDFIPGALKEMSFAESTKGVADTLHIYGDETITQIDYEDNESYLVRAINSFHYKGVTVSDIVGAYTKWDRIRGRLDVAESDFGKVKDMPLYLICRNEWEWSELVNMVFAEDISDEILYKVKKDILDICGDRSISQSKKTELVADVIYNIPSARLTNINRQQLLRDVGIIIEFVNQVFDEEKFISLIKSAYHNRFIPQIEEAIKVVRYDKVRNLQYAEALFRILAVMHPMLLDIPGLTEWNDIKDKDFISLRIFREFITTANAKIIIDPLKMQERTLEARKNPIAFPSLPTSSTNNAYKNLNKGL